MAERLNDRRFTFKNDIVSLKKKKKKEKVHIKSDNRSTSCAITVKQMSFILPKCVAFQRILMGI